MNIRVLILARLEEIRRKQLSPINRPTKDPLDADKTIPPIRKNIIINFPNFFLKGS
jgi:hypothetical protein